MDKTVSFKLSAATEDAKAKLDQITARLDELTRDAKSIKVGVDDTAAKLQLDDFAYKLERLKDQGISPEISLKGYFKTLAELDRLELKMHELNRISSESGVGGGLRQSIVGWLGDLLTGTGGTGGLVAVGGGGAGAAGVLGGIADAASSLGVAGWAALIPIIMGAVNVVGDLVSGLAAAGQGLLAFGALAYPEFDTLLTAVGKGKAGLKGLDKEQQGIVLGALNIENEYQRLAAKIAPYVDQILSIFTMKGGIGSQVLQDLLPFAQAVAPVIEKLTKSFNSWLASPGAEQFQKLMIKMAPGVVEAIGEGIGHIAVAVGKLLEVFGRGDNAVKVINFISDGLYGLIRTLTLVVGAWNRGWDLSLAKVLKFQTDFLVILARVSGDIENWAGDVGHWLETVRLMWDKLPGELSDALGAGVGKIFDMGKNLVESLIRGMDSIPVLGEVFKIGQSIVSGFAHILGIHSPSTEGIRLGASFTEGIQIGMSRMAAGFNLSVAGIGGVAGAGGTGGSGGWIEVKLVSAGEPALDALMAQTRAYIRVRGGGGPSSVQRALGTGVA